MQPSPFRTNIPTSESSFNPILSSPSVTSRSLSHSCSKDSKLKPLNELISRQNQYKNNKITQNEPKIKQFFSNTVQTKQIHLNLVDTHQQPYSNNCSNMNSNPSTKRNSNSKTKLSLSLKKGFQLQQSSRQIENSGEKIEIERKKQKISLLGKISTLKSTSLDKLQIIQHNQQNHTQKNSSGQTNKQNLIQCNDPAAHNNKFQPINYQNYQNCPNQAISNLMMEKLNNKKDIFGSRPIKTTKEILLMKSQHKSKDKIKIKLQKKTIQNPFRY